MVNITTFTEILEGISPENGFMQVANIFATINKMSVDELLIFWQTLKHFELAQRMPPSNLQMTNLKKSAIIAMKNALIAMNPSMVTVINSPYHMARERVVLTLNGEDKELFGRSILGMHHDWQSISLLVFLYHKKPPVPGKIAIDLRWDLHIYTPNTFYHQGKDEGENT